MEIIINIEIQYKVFLIRICYEYILNANYIYKALYM
jgi:hypothetical protein